MKRNHSKLFTKIFSAVVISLSSLCFLSCGDIINFLVPVLFGQYMSGLTAEPGDGFVSLSWDNGYSSGYLYLETKRTDTNTLVEVNCGWLDADEQGFLPSSCVVDGLTNDVSYTFTLCLFEQKSLDSNLINHDSVRATPVADAVGGDGFPISLNVSEGKYFVDLPYNVSTLTITGASGKMITYANVNTNTTVNKANVIKASAARRYVSGLPRSADTGIQEVASATVDDAGKITSPVRHFTAPDSVTLLPDSGRSAERAADSWNKSNPQIGQTRTMYVDADQNLSSFTKEQMTLYAIGYKPGTTSSTANKNNIACLVWAKSSDVEKTNFNTSNTKISLGAIEDIALKFVEHYQFEESVFGETSDMLLTEYGKTSMVNDGPTENWVNIVLYDIGRDGTSGNCGVVGYFWAKDYYRKGVSNSSSDPISLTNEGKYFYVDVPFCNYDSEDNKYHTENNSVSGTVISTLFHEYQHMIDFNTKTMEKNPSLNTNNCIWYNEMLSMLCEDIMGEQLGLTPADRVATGRIKNFNAYYYYSGAAQYLETNSWVSYGTAYAFGAWLVRNYGGVPLITEMSNNNDVGIDSIVKAVNTVHYFTGADKTWNDLFEEYIQACAFRTAFAGDKPLPTFNKVPGPEQNRPYTMANTNGSVTLYAAIGYDSNHYSLSSKSENVSATLEGSLKGINLWSDNYKNKSTYGPVILGSNSAVDVQPTGFVFHNVGRITKDEDVTLRFTTTSNQNEKLYIFVQDYEPSNQHDTTEEVTQS
ncbi:MAG: hypothetical protein J6Y16_09410 [Treponema sp.]|nr:hypothetical protein [Treponema sp.]